MERYRFISFIKSLEFKTLMYILKQRFLVLSSIRFMNLLRHDSRLKSYDFTMEDIDKIEKELISYADKIRVDDVWTPIPTRLCNWCDFKEICPAQKAW